MAWLSFISSMLPVIPLKKKHRRYFKLKDNMENTQNAFDALLEIIRHLENPRNKFKINTQRHQAIVRFLSSLLKDPTGLFPTPPSTIFLLGLFKALSNNLKPKKSSWTSSPIQNA